MFSWIKRLLGIKKSKQKGTIETKKPLSSLEVINNNEESMKFLIVGLGNMEMKYDGTRHNVGFEIADALVEEKKGSYEIVKYGLQSIVKHKGKTLIIHKPNTFMNLSGKAVKYWMEKHKIKRENILIVADDIHLDFELIRLKARGSHAGHNGLKDIEEKLSGNNYPRLKIGIGADFKQGRQVEYVLGKWSNKELDELSYIHKRAVDAILDFVSIGISRAMNTHNKKPK